MDKIEVRRTLEKAGYLVTGELNHYGDVALEDAMLAHMVNADFTGDSWDTAEILLYKHWEGGEDLERVLIEKRIPYSVIDSSVDNRSWARDLIDKCDNEFWKIYEGRKVRVALDRVPLEFRVGLDDAGIVEGENYEVIGAWARPVGEPLPFNNETWNRSMSYMLKNGLPENTLKLKIEDKDWNAYACFFDLVE